MALKRDREDEERETVPSMANWLSLSLPQTEQTPSINPGCVYSCKYCGEVFSSSQALRRHRASHMRPINLSSQKLEKHKCPICDHEFFLGKSVTEHHMRKHLKLEERSTNHTKRQRLPPTTKEELDWEAAYGGAPNIAKNCFRKQEDQLRDTTKILPLMEMVPVSKSFSICKQDYFNIGQELGGGHTRRQYHSTVKDHRLQGLSVYEENSFLDHKQVADTKTLQLMEMVPVSKSFPTCGKEFSIGQEKKSHTRRHHDGTVKHRLQDGSMYEAPIKNLIFNQKELANTKTLQLMEMVPVSKSLPISLDLNLKPSCLYD